MTPEEFAGIDKLHTLLDVAISDGEKVLEEEALYVPEAQEFHKPICRPLQDEAMDGRCWVCAAGAVMAMTLGARVYEDAWPAQYPQAINRRLRAIDELREGYLSSALAHMVDWSRPPKDLRYREKRITAEFAGELSDTRLRIQYDHFNSAASYTKFLGEMRVLQERLAAIDV